MLGWPALPYQTIGKFTVVLLATLAVLAVLFVALMLFIVVIQTVMAKISARAWTLSPRDGDPPPEWKIKVAGVSYALSKLNLNKVSEAYHAAETVDREQTNYQAMKSYMDNVFN